MRALLSVMVTVLLPLTSGAALAKPTALPIETPDGLKLVAERKVDAAYVRPGVDFSGYRRFAILEPSVAFRKHWERDLMRKHIVDYVRPQDAERIRLRMAVLLHEVFSTELEQAGYALTHETAEDVLVLRPSITELDVAAPKVSSATRSEFLVKSAGSATLSMAFYDSVTGQLLAWAIDHQQAREYPTFESASGSFNHQEARNVVRQWAQVLVQRLRAIHGER